jgi:hypothetical protein
MIGIGMWIAQHGMDCLEAVGIVGGLLYTGRSFSADTRSRRLANLLSLTKQHREIWREVLEKPELTRIKESKADLYTKPVTPDEARLVNFLLLHLHCWYRAVLEGEVLTLESLSRDIRSFFALPIPRRVWEENRQYYEPDFAAFVDATLNS